MQIVYFWFPIVRDTGIKWVLIFHSCIIYVICDFIVDENSSIFGIWKYHQSRKCDGSDRAKNK